VFLFSLVAALTTLGLRLVGYGFAAASGAHPPGLPQPRSAIRTKRAGSTPGPCLRGPVGLACRNALPHCDVSSTSSLSLVPRPRSTLTEQKPWIFQFDKDTARPRPTARLETGPTVPFRDRANTAHRQALEIPLEESCLFPPLKSALKSPRREAPDITLEQDRDVILPAPARLARPRSIPSTRPSLSAVPVRSRAASWRKPVM